MFTHRLQLDHYRDPLAVTLSDVPVDSTLNIESTSTDLTEACRELLSRMPADLYAAMKQAMDETR